MTKLLDPKNDVVFLKVIWDEESQEYID